MKPQNTADVVNSICLVLGRDDAANIERLLGLLSDLDAFVGAFPAKLRRGNRAELAGLVTSFPRDGACFLRRDHSSWVAELILMAQDGTYIFVSASLRTISVFSNRLATAITISDQSIDGQKSIEAVAGRITGVLDVARQRRPDAAKTSKFALLSQRVYDCLQALEHFHQYFKVNPAAADQEVLVVNEVSLINTPLVRSVLPLAVRNVSRAEVSALRRNPEVDIIAALDWHWGAKSTATVNALTSLVSVANLPALPKAEGRAVFISLELEKRIWFEQQAALTRAINHLRDRHGVTSVLINGLTAPEGLPTHVAFHDDVLTLEEDFARDIAMALGGVSFHSLHRKTLVEKLQMVRGCSYFIAPAGSAALLPILCDVPGILYGTPDYLRTSKNLIPQDTVRFHVINPAWVKPLAEDYSVKKYSWSSNKPQGQSYSIESDLFISELKRHAEKTIFAS